MQDLPTQPEAADLRGLLLIDADPGVRALLERAAPRHGFRAVPAETGDAALALLTAAAAAVEVAVLDTGPSAATVARTLEGLRRARPELPVLVVGGDTARLPAAERLPPRSAVLRKPFGPDAFFAALARLTGPAAS